MLETWMIISRKLILKIDNETSQSFFNEISRNRPNISKYREKAHQIVFEIRKRFRDQMCFCHLASSPLISYLTKLCYKVV